MTEQPYERSSRRSLMWIGDSQDDLKRQRPTTWKLTQVLKGEPGSMVVRCSRRGGHIVAVVPPANPTRARMVYTDDGMGHVLEPAAGGTVESACGCAGGTSWPLDLLRLRRLADRGEKSMLAGRVAPPVGDATA